MKNRPDRRKRKFSKRSASLTVEFLERRVVLNADPTGGVLITGSPFEGQALTASNNIVDADGLGPIAYQWKSDSDPIPDATSPTYVLQDSDVGKVITVVATYTDLLGTEEVVSSQPTEVIESSSPPVRQSSAVSYSPDYTTINGRTFGYYVPESYDPSTPTPLLFMFHGAGGNSSEQSGGSAENGYYGWQTSAHQNGFIVLFPESSGYFKTWDLGGGGSSSDLSFVDDMIDWASTNYNISTSQIFTTGHSWGAYFSYYVATFRSDDIAAFGAHSGGLGGAFFLGNTPPVPTGPNPTPSLNGIVLHAVDDGIVPYSNSQNLYDGLVANGHNVYDDGIGADGIIEVDGWGPDNHRYRLQHNQTQWDFFLSVAPNPVTSNQPPEFNQPLDLILNEDASTQSVSLTGISSGDGLQQPVRVSATSSNPGFIPDPTVSYTNSSATGSLVVVPVGNQHGAATITVTVEDGGLDNNLETAGDNAIVSQTFEVTVISVNDPGSFSGDTSATGLEDDAAITGALAFTDAIDGDSAPSYTITSESSNGAASIDATTGVWSYAPNANFNGSDSFAVTVTDDDGHAETQVISLLVEALNDPGSFSGGTSALGSEDDSAITGTLVFTDTIDGDSAPSYTITSESSSGTAFIDAITGAWSYTPNANFNGLDSFTVAVTDDEGHTETQVISLTVTSVNDPGSFTGNTSATGSEDDSTITGTLVFTDAIDGDSVPNYTITSESNNGTASIDATTGVWSYAPNVNFNGSDSFTVTVTDDEGHTETQVVSLIITSVNDPGSFSGDTSATGSEDASAITGTLVFTDAIDGDSAPNYTITAESNNGTASIDATNGVWSYTPNTNFNGTDSFTVTVTDDESHTETHVINLIVEAVNDVPTLDALTDITRNEGDGEQTVSLRGITAGGGETQLLWVTAVSDNTGLIPDPTVNFDSQSSTGTLKFTPAADQFGTATITVLVEDGGLDNDLGTQEDNGTVSRVFDVVLAPVNDEPVFDPVADLVLPENSLTQVLEITGISAGVGENQPLQITTSSSNTSVVLDPTVTSQSVLGTDTRLITVTPVPDRYGIATITVIVEDGGLDLDLNTAEDNAMFSRTFDVTVTPDTDDPPSPVTPHGRMFIHETLSGDSLVSYQLPAVNVNGEAINGLPNRVTVTSSNTALIPDPTVLYASTDVPSSLSFTPVADANGTATLSIQVEDGGPDNDFATTEDNRQATHQVEVNVLEVISNQGAAILAKDDTENLYANTQPVTYQEQQAQTNIAGFAVIGASSEDGENALLVERSSVTSRLVTDDAWRINGLFESLQNESSPVLDLSAREVSSTLNIAVVSGAYEINGANAPTLIVRRGQTYAFNLNTAEHPFFLQTTIGSGYQSQNVYSNGFDGNGQTAGSYTWTVPLDAPNELFYQCEFHAGMNGRIIISDLPSNGE